MRRTVRDYVQSEEERHDLTMTIALSVVEQLVAGVPERTAYGRAEGAAEAAQLADRTCGLTGDSHALRTLRTIRGQPEPAENPWARAQGGRRLTPGDWRALRTWLARQLPDPLAGRRPSARLLLEGLLCERESLHVLAERLGLSDAAAASTRSRALLACTHALGLQPHRTYDRRQRPAPASPPPTETEGPRATITATRGVVVQP